MKFRNTLLAFGLLSAIVLSGCGNNNTVNLGDPANQPTGPVGSIRGHVRLMGDAPKPATDTITQDQGTCGNSVSLPRIALGSDNAVQSTFVFLDGVSDAAAPAPVKQSVLIDQKDCQYVPHAMIVPLGSTVEITNSDPILHNVHGTQATSDGMQTVFNYAQARQGQRETIDMTMTKPGIVYLSCEAGHPWMSAFVYVAKDPYVAVTDSTGEFVIKDVPPGTYTIKMWHEGVILKQIHKSLQTYEYEAPYEISQQVTVTANNEATVNFDFVLRSE